MLRTLALWQQGAEMTRIVVALIALGISSAVPAQSTAQQPTMASPRSPTSPAPAPVKSDATVDQLVKDYEAAFNKGDAKALAALYAQDALRLGPDNQLLR